MPLPTRLLNETVTVNRPTRSDDGAGGWTESLTLIGDVQGRIRPTTSREREAAAHQEADVTHVVYTLTAADIKRGDELTARGQTLVVEAIREPSVTGHHYEIDCVERQHADH